MRSLGYLDLYRLCEEFQQFKGAQLQAVFNPAKTRYVLELRLAGSSRHLIFDLSPSCPLVLSTSSTKLKSPGTRNTPIFNFLRAHFVNRRIESLEIAQKPNRTIRVVFANGPELFFKCYPHGQHLILKAEKKVVNFPLRPPEKSEVETAYIEPEVVKEWSFNDEIDQQFNERGISPVQGESYQSKVIKKLERALKTLEEGVADQTKKDLGRIEVLEKQALTSKGSELDSIYDEIKRLKKKQQITVTRKKDLLSQLEKLKSEPQSEMPSSLSKNKKTSFEKIFSGTRVRLSESWELWVGRDAHQNDDLLRLGSSSDLWIHLRDYPGAHGLIRGPKKTDPSPNQIEMACQIVALLSQSKKRPFLEGDRLDVIVTPKKFVKKRKGDAPGRVIVERESVRRIAFRSVKFQVI